MTKYMLMMETDQITWVKVKKSNRLLVSLWGRLYRNDDQLYVKDKHSSDAIRITPIDSNQVGMVKGGKSVYVNPNDTRAIIMSKEIGGTKKKSWLNLDASKIGTYLIIAIVVGVVAYTILTGGLKL